MEDLDVKDEDDLGRKKILVNTIVTYGCPPSQGVPAKSTIALSYFRQLKMTADANDGRIKFPSALNFYTGIDGKCETISKVKEPLILHWQRERIHSIKRNLAMGMKKKVSVTKKKIKKELKIGQMRSKDKYARS